MASVFVVNPGHREERPLQDAEQPLPAASLGPPWAEAASQQPSLSLCPPLETAARGEGQAAPWSQCWGKPTFKLAPHSTSFCSPLIQRQQGRESKESTTHIPSVDQGLHSSRAWSCNPDSGQAPADFHEALHQKVQTDPAFAH